MKILHVSLSNIGGGASKVVRSLNYELNKCGIESTLLVYEGLQDTNTLIFTNSNYFKLLYRVKNKIVEFIMFFFKNKSFDYRSINLFSSSSIINYINELNYDIVHLHWIGAELIKIEDIPKIKASLVWTLHDAWPLNGSYHINPDDYFSSTSHLVNYSINRTNLLENWTLCRKEKYWKNKKIIFTAPSNWFVSKFEKSFNNNGINECVLIPNFIDFRIWIPINKNSARNKLNINTSKKIIVFGANNVVKSFNKGFRFVLKLMNTLPKENYMFIVFGNNNVNFNKFSNCDVCNFGKIEDLNFQKLLYSAGDFTIVPSLSESFSMVTLESLSCNTPVLAFDESGIESIIEHKNNGFLSKKNDFDSLLEGIAWLSNNTLNNVDLTVKRYDINKVVNSFIKLYNTL